MLMILLAAELLVIYLAEFLILEIKSRLSSTKQASGN